MLIASFLVTKQSLSRNTFTTKLMMKLISFLNIID